MTRLPKPFDPNEAFRLRTYTGPDYSGPVLLSVDIPTDEPVGAFVFIEYFSGRREDVAPWRLSPASIVDQIMFQQDRNDYVKLLRAKENEEKQLNEENQDLAVGDRVIYLPSGILSEIQTAIDMWVDHFIRPDMLPLLTDRRRLWHTEGTEAVVVKPPRRVGGRFKLGEILDSGEKLVEWYRVRRKS